MLISKEVVTCNEIYRSDVSDMPSFIFSYGVVWSSVRVSQCICYLESLVTTNHIVAVF